MKNVKISKIEITIGSRKIELTLEEAKRLRKELDALLGQEVTYPNFPQIIYKEKQAIPDPTWPPGDPIPYRWDTINKVEERDVI